MQMIRSNASALTGFGNCRISGLTRSVSGCNWPLVMR